ncbi:hypothetical protein DEGR_24460 [Deinococcus grandis]|nr:hypothetical protein DEGR_24460 [Deinococcus grandis]
MVGALLISGAGWALRKTYPIIKEKQRQADESDFRINMRLVSSLDRLIIFTGLSIVMTMAFALISATLWAFFVMNDAKSPFWSDIIRGCLGGAMIISVVTTYDFFKLAEAAKIREKSKI